MVSIRPYGFDMAPDYDLTVEKRSSVGHGVSSVVSIEDGHDLPSVSDTASTTDDSLSIRPVGGTGGGAACSFTTVTDLYLSPNVITPSTSDGIRYSLSGDGKDREGRDSDNGRRAAGGFGSSRSKSGLGKQRSFRRTVKPRSCIGSNAKDTPASASTKKKKKKRKNSPSEATTSAAAGQNKIFLLLLQPRCKTFEMIQIVYPPETTTVGDLLGMIASNATEPSLGKQTYTGLTRPRKRTPPLLDLERLASGDVGHKGDGEEDKENAHNGRSNDDSGGIKSGEVLVAIPAGYKANQIINISKHILSNRRVQKLLDKSRRPSTFDGVSSESRSRNPRLPQWFAPTPRVASTRCLMESVVEDEDDDINNGNESLGEEETCAAVKRAMDAAEAANAAVLNRMRRPLPMARRESAPLYLVSPEKNNTNSRCLYDSYGGGSDQGSRALLGLRGPSPPPTCPSTATAELVPRSDSLTSSCESTNSSMTYNTSYSAFTESFDASFVTTSMLSFANTTGSNSMLVSSTGNSKIEKNAAFATTAMTTALTDRSSQEEQLRRKRERNRCTKNVKRAAAAVGLVMVARYLTDPNGYVSHRSSQIAHRPMGFWGTCQFLATSVVLAETQKYYAAAFPMQDNAH